MFELKDYLDLFIGLAITLIMGIMLAKIVGKKYIVLVFIGMYGAIFTANYFALTVLTEVLASFGVAGIVVIFVLHSSQIRRQFFKKAKKVKTTNLAAPEREQLIQTLNEAVLDLSKTKTGALITIETTEDLKEFIDKGVRVDAKVSSSLLRTIFYPGTPLHDGAIIIKGDVIEAGAVFYVPTTRAMVGKFGARHRAAIGFSEQHEGITIIVSEETGRISLAVQGELIHATHENFSKKLEEYIK